MGVHARTRWSKFSRSCRGLACRRWGQYGPSPRLRFDRTADLVFTDFPNVKAWDVHVLQMHVAPDSGTASSDYI